MNKVLNWFKQLLGKFKSVSGEVKQLEQELVLKKYRFKYKTELQVVFRNQQVLCTDYVYSEVYECSEEYLNNHKNEYHDVHIKSYIDSAFKNGVLHTFDKSNRYYTKIVTSDITRILYKQPTYEIEVL